MLQMSQYRNRALRSATSLTLGDELFVARDSFTPGLLPSQKSVIEMMMYILTPRGKGIKQVTREEAEIRVAHTLTEHWVWCNIYTIQMKNVIAAVSRLYAEFKKLTSTMKVRQTPKWLENTLKPYLERVNGSLLDIATNDPVYKKKQEDIQGVKMTQAEHDFYEDQKGPRVMYCDSFVDQQWLHMAERRQKDKETLESRKARAEQDKDNLSKVSQTDSEDEDHADDEDYCVDQEDVSVEGDETKRKRKRKFEETLSKETSEMPKDWKPGALILVQNRYFQGDF